MQNLNVVLPEKEDFQRWIREVKQEILLELRKEITVEREHEPEYLTREEMSKKYRISLVTLNSLTVKMKIPSIKVGKRRLFEKKTVENYFNSKILKNQR
jgi:excisionase family DNA binding protein